MATHTQMWKMFASVGVPSKLGSPEGILSERQGNNVEASSICELFLNGTRELYLYCEIGLSVQFLYICWTSAEYRLNIRWIFILFGRIEIALEASNSANLIYFDPSRSQASESPEQFSRMSSKICSLNQMQSNVTCNTFIRLHCMDATLPSMAMSFSICLA